MPLESNHRVERYFLNWGIRSSFASMSMVRGLEMRTGLMGFVQIGGNLAGIADLTANHERGIDDDPGEPGGKARPSVEAADMGVGTQEGILEGVLGVFAIARNVESDLKQLCSVRPAKGFECVRAAAAGGSQQVGLSALRNGTFRNTGSLPRAERHEDTTTARGYQN